VADALGFVVVDVVLETAQNFDHFARGIDFNLGVIDIVPDDAEIFRRPMMRTFCQAPPVPPAMGLMAAK